MSRVLVISPDEIKREMAGPAMRAFELAKHLRKDHKVNLVHRPENLASLISQNDVIICQHLAFNHHPILLECNKSLVFDLYNLSIFECLEIAIKESPQYQALFGEYRPLVNVYIEVLKKGDFFICANEHQRNFWLGMLTALGRIDINRYRDEDKLKNLIDIVPFGIPDEPPVHTKTVLKGAYPHIKPEDKVIIWAGGVYDWLDPVTSVKAMHKVVTSRPEIKLFFMGTKNPHGALPQMQVCQQAIKLSQDLGLYDRNVFFNGWVDYHQRQNYLLGSDIGITTHHKNMESYFSSRTRILDYIWANLPIIISEGDSFSEIVRRYNLGLVVKDKAVDELCQAILKLLDDKDFYNNCKKNIKKIAPDFYWDKVIEPLNRFCHSPRISQDKTSNFTMNNNFRYHISKLPYYINYYGYKVVLIKIIKRISGSFKQKTNTFWNTLKKILVLAFSFCVLCITFAVILSHDLIVMLMCQRKR